MQEIIKVMESQKINKNVSSLKNLMYFILNKYIALDYGSVTY